MPVTPLNIKDAEAYELASAIAEHTGKTLTRVVVDALRAEKERVIPRKWNQERIDQILARVDALPMLDPRSTEEILDEIYDENGLIR